MIFQKHIMFNRINLYFFSIKLQFVWKNVIICKIYALISKNLKQTIFMPIVCNAYKKTIAFLLYDLYENNLKQMMTNK